MMASLGGGGGVVVLPYMGYIGMCGSKGYGFSAVWVINRISILADFMGMFLRRSHFFIIMEKKIKSSSQIMFTVTYSNIRLNWGTNYNAR